MTGIYLRVKRDEKWQALEIEELTEEELREVFKLATKERVIAFLYTALAAFRQVE